MPRHDGRGSRKVRARHACAWWVSATLVAAAHATARPTSDAATTPPGVLQRAVAINRLSMQLTNCGSFASDHLFDPDNYSGFGGLEFPRGSGIHIAFAGGIWFSGVASGTLHTAIADYGTEYVPGPFAPGGSTTDTLRFKVYSVARGDTAGAGEWMARAVPLGAPVDSTGSHPGLIGDQTAWTVFNDGSGTQIYGHGPRTPIGLEVQVTAYAFDRAPALQNVVFMHLRLIHRGNALLDSAFVGLWYDADIRTARIPAASDTSLDLGYVYRLTDDDYYGAAGPATGLAVLRGPRDPNTHLPMRARSIVGWTNGADPYNDASYAGVMRGLYPWGDAMLDSTTSQPTLYYAWGDPVTGSGWLMPNIVDPKLALGLGPFQFAPGDTQDVDVVLAVGQGHDRATSVVALRDNVREARAAFASGFSAIPAPLPPPIAPLVARPTPTGGAVVLDVRVPSGGAEVRIEILDLSGRHVRSLGVGRQADGVAHVTWDGTLDGGGRAPAGIYIARSHVAGDVRVARIVLVP